MGSETQYGAPMKIKTKQFSEAIGETYTTVRDVFGRPGREPRFDFGEEFNAGSHRRFSWLDALAWRITRHLTQLGLTWDQAAAVVKREMPADRYAKDPDRAPYFGVWETKGQTGLAAWCGTAAEIAEIFQHDNANYGLSVSLRMVSLAHAEAEALEIARSAGFEVKAGEFWSADEGEAK